MKYLKLYLLACIGLFSCNKDEIVTEETLLEMESISGLIDINDTLYTDEICVYLMTYTLTNDTVITILDTIHTDCTMTGTYLFDQIIPPSDDLLVGIDLPSGLKLENAYDLSPDNDLLESGIDEGYIGVQINGDENDTDNNFYLTSTAPCQTKVSGYVYVIDANGVQSPSDFMDVIIVERDNNSAPNPWIYEQVETDINGYYELVVNEGNELSITPSILDYPFLFTQLDTLIVIDETPDGDPNQNADEGYLDVDLILCEHDDQNNFYYFLKPIPNKITGSVFIDENNDGIGDIPLLRSKVELFARDVNGQPTGPEIDQDFSDGAGNFIFNNVSDGEYVLVLHQKSLYPLVASFDEDQESGEPDNPIINYISVDINDGISDHLNYFIVERETGCDIDFEIMPYWALCDTNIICSLNEIPLILVDEYQNPILILDGEATFNWTNLTTGQTSTSDVINWYPNQIIKLELTLSNGCNYKLYYNRNCESDFNGTLSLMNKSLGFGGYYQFYKGDILWTFEYITQTLTINHTIIPPAGASTFPPGIYEYRILPDNKMEITNIMGQDFELGEIGYENGFLFIDDDSAADGIRWEFKKQ